jgi:YebC/PmpR family DNA-binding regulatory protein
MGRIFEKRKYRMFARWSKTAKAFTRIGKEISIAVKLSGPDPAGNPRLRMAIQTARGLNMPKDRIEAAIHRASSKDETGLREAVYAGYAPHGIAVMIDTATDNPTRTVANIRSIFTHHGGSLASTSSIEFLFKHQGVFKVTVPAAKHDDLELELIDHGLTEFESEGDEVHLFSEFANFER